MEQAPEKDIENKLYNYLKENQGKAFTIGALKKKFEAFTIDPLIREYYSKNFLTILKKMRDNGKIKLTQHEGKTHYFIPEIFKSAQDKGVTQHFAPKIFISAETYKKRIKKKYCKQCKKEVIVRYKFQKGDHSLFFPTLASLTQKSIEARKNTGWFCPNCGERVEVLYKKVKIIIFLSGVILLAILMIAGLMIAGELQIYLFVYALILSVLLIIIAIRQLIRWILKKRGRKIFEKIKNQPKEYFDSYIRR